MATEHNHEKSPTGSLKWVRWTGFFDKTLWDWMQLLVVPIVLGGGVIWFQQQADSRARESEAQRSQVQLSIENDRAQQSGLQAYLANIGVLLLDKNLFDANENAPVREIARAATLNTLRQLDPDRKGIVITFLYDSGLIRSINRLGDRDPSGTGPIEENFITLAEAAEILADSDSLLATIDDHIEELALRIGVAPESIVIIEDLIIRLDKADLSGANLDGAFLEGVDLFDTNLSGAILTDALFSRSILALAVLTGANLTGADLSNANLESADFTGATVTNQQLASAEFLEGLILPDGSSIDSEEAALAFKQQYGGSE